VPPAPPPPERSTALLLIAGPVADGAAVRALCERLRAVIANTDARQTIAVDVGALHATCRSIEALARLQLTASRAHRRIRLQRASPALEQLLDFAGLADVVPTAGAPN
jgi:hypothetical protein